MFSINLSLAGVLCGVTLSAIVFLLVYVFVSRSPLDRIPDAHWTSSLSPLWILWIRYQNIELKVLEEKHRQLGPVVRVGPADLSISCYENGVKTIYGGGFEKPEYYNFFAYYGRKNAFCSMSRYDHSVRRKRVTAAHSKSSLFSSDQLFSLTEDILVKRFLPILDGHSSLEQPTEILSLSYALSIDLLTCFQFGVASGSNFLQNPVKLTHWLEHYEERYCKAAFWPQELPALTHFLKIVGIDMLPKTQYQSTQYLEDWLLEMCDHAEAVQLAIEKKDTEVLPRDVPVIYTQVKRGVEIDSHDASTDAKRMEIASELFDHMSGGREVLGLVLAYTIYHISLNPDAQARLQSELATLEPCIRWPKSTTSKYQESSPLPSPDQLDRLPYLSAVLKESFRMRPNSTPLPRVTPRDRPVSLAGFDNIPPGTRVNVFQWFIHRNPANYDRVDEWHPERWLGTKPEDGKNSLLWAFGGGSRMCLGVSLTQYLMRYILAAIYMNFSSTLVFKESGPHEPGSPGDRISVRFESLYNETSSTSSGTMHGE